MRKISEEELEVGNLDVHEVTSASVLAVVDLLVEKGICTSDEYLEKFINRIEGMKEEKE
ncbi:hypothetical protein KGR20_21880 [Cytobacillus oceanisediminis]|uniref:hypothetical protein n=1 Tax=Cytobacillus oceanisediminis TaxID=665099 RepID=UPI001CC9969C|nr:hypothetical protein [Cytobacillus oceanisediminis]MBZ9536813.1 hypothetical protein [Cytobacillus oceanisediminis]